MHSKKPEILAPAGSFETAYYAFLGGADAVYLGLEKFSARKSAKNFNFDQLRRLKSLAHEKKKKIFITINTVILESELAELLETLSSRVEIVKQIGKYKKDNNVTALQINRWTQLMENRVNLGKSLDLNETFVKILFQLIHEDSVRMQTEIMDE